MARSLTSSLTALNAPAKQAQMTRMSSSEEASWLTPPRDACPTAVGRAEGCALALPDAGVLALPDAGPLAGAEAFELAWPDAGALAWPDAGPLAGAEVLELGWAEAGALAWPEAGALAWPEADGLAWGAADARATCCAATACGDGCDFLVWVPEGLGLALGLAP